MNIYAINGINEINKKTDVNFKRRLNPDELEVYTEALNKGLKLLDKKVDIIIHNSAAPSSWGENTGIGSLFSRTTQELLIPFLKSHGFSGIQQEPNNLRKIGDPSPYAPESSAKNIYMIPLEKLASSKYHYILPRTVFEYIVNHSNNLGYVDFDQVNANYDLALKFAYDRSKQNLSLENDFKKFKANNPDIEKAAIFRLLNNIHKKHWEEWEGIDKNLYSPRNQEEKILAEKRISQLKKKYYFEIDIFYFQQFLIELENKESNKLAEQSGIKIIGDSPVASPAADEWIYQELFLKDKAIGCPPDAFSSDGQRWGFKYFNPKYIFNPDGTLGKAGKILKEKYDKFFASFPGGLRIDHVIGLVDPFIYNVKSSKMPSAQKGRIYSAGEFKKNPEEYSNIMEKIVLQSAKEHGMDKSSIICEDLGEPNIPTQEVMKKLKLSGIGVTQFDYRGADMPKDSVIMLGSHDNLSFIEYTNNLFKCAIGKNLDRIVFINKIKTFLSKFFHFKSLDINKELMHFINKTDLLAKDTAPAGITQKRLKQYAHEIRSDKKKFLEAGFTELFTSPARRIQIFFTDFWGMGKTYNRPGTSDGNWILRINNNFENDYYKAVAEGKAPNLAQIVANALRHRGLEKDNEELLEDLDSSAKILKEK